MVSLFPCLFFPVQGYSEVVYPSFHLIFLEHTREHVHTHLPTPGGIMRRNTVIQCKRLNLISGRLKTFSRSQWSDESNHCLWTPLVWIPSPDSTLTWTVTSISFFISSRLFFPSPPSSRNHEGLKKKNPTWGVKCSKLSSSRFFTVRFLVRCTTCHYTKLQSRKKSLKYTTGTERVREHVVTDATSSSTMTFKYFIILITHKTGEHRKNFPAFSFHLS